MDDLLKALEQYDGDRISLAIDPRQLFMIISHLQLALRHPDNTGESAIAVRAMTERLIDILAQVVPETRPILEMGWNECYDVAHDYFDEEF